MALTSKMTWRGLRRPVMSRPSNSRWATAAIAASNFSPAGSSLTKVRPYSRSTAAGLAQGS